MRIFNLVGVSFAAHLPNCNLTDHSVETFDEYSQGSNDLFVTCKSENLLFAVHGSLESVVMVAMEPNMMKDAGLTMIPMVD